MIFNYAYHVRVVGVALAAEAQLVIVVQAREAPVRVGEVLEVLLGRRTRRVVKRRREVRRLKVRLRQLVLHGRAVVEPAGAPVVCPGTARAVAGGTAT